MKERSIIMCTDLIPATLDGTKTETRRTTGLDEINKNPDKWRLSCDPCVYGARYRKELRQSL